MKNQIFRTLKKSRLKRNNFDLSHDVKLSCNLGYLVPIMTKHALPGDTFRFNARIMARFAPMTAPMLQNVDIKTYYFKVPYRLLWNDWEEFITGGVDGPQFDNEGNPINTPSFPRFRIGGSMPTTWRNYFAPGSLADYLGYPTTRKGDDGKYNVPANPVLEMSELPLRAYALIYNEYFRDQNLEDEIYIPKTGGLRDIHEEHENGSTSIIQALLQLRKKAWDKDYFTSALPEPQRGVDVPLPIGERDVVLVDPPFDKPQLLRNYLGGEPLKSNVEDADDLYVGSYLEDGESKYGALSKHYSELSDGIQINSGQNVYLDPNGTLRTRETDNLTITEVRRAFKLQEFLERMMVGGSRYIEQIKSIFGVTSSDARLQRPEFLGGFTQPVIVSEVLQTSSSDATSPQGNMSGRALSVDKNGFVTTYCEEHCLIMGLMCIIPQASYYGGISRDLTKFDQFDYYFPQFDHIGEQAILNKELYVDISDSDATSNSNVLMDEEFGYAPRYAEYKSELSRVHGEFKTSLDFWHMARTFDSTPMLNSSFIKPDSTVMNRVFAVQDDSIEKVYVEMYFNFVAKRLMSKYSTPYL